MRLGALGRIQPSRCIICLSTLSSYSFLWAVKERSHVLKGLKDLSLFSSSGSGDVSLVWGKLFTSKTPLLTMDLGLAGTKSGKSCHKFSLSQGSTELIWLIKEKWRTQIDIEMKCKLIPLCLCFLETEVEMGMLVKMVYWKSILRWNLYGRKKSSIGPGQKLSTDVVWLKCSLSLSPEKLWDMKSTTVI